MTSKLYLKILPLTAVLILTIAFDGSVAAATPKPNPADRAQFEKVFKKINQNKADSEALLKAVKAKNMGQVNRILQRNGYQGGPVVARNIGPCVCRVFQWGVLCACWRGGQGSYWETE